MTPLSIWDPVKRCRVLNPKAFEPELEITMDTPKTILAPNAPWPNKPPEQTKPPVRRVRVPKPTKPPSKTKLTDQRYEQWAAKNLGENYGK